MTRTGTLYLPEDAYGFFTRKTSTMGALQEAQGGISRQFQYRAR